MGFGAGKARHPFRETRKERASGNGNIQGLTDYDAQIENIIHYCKTVFNTCNLHLHLRVQNGNAVQPLGGAVFHHPSFSVPSRDDKDDWPPAYHHSYLESRKLQRQDPAHPHPSPFTPVPTGTPSQSCKPDEGQDLCGKWLWLISGMQQPFQELGCLRQLRSPSTTLSILLRQTSFGDTFSAPTPFIFSASYRDQEPPCHIHTLASAFCSVIRGLPLPPPVLKTA